MSNLTKIKTILKNNFQIFGGIFLGILLLSFFWDINTLLAFESKIWLFIMFIIGCIGDYMRSKK